MSFKKISLIILILLLVATCACSSKPKTGAEAQLQAYSGEEEYLAAREATQGVSFAMMAVSTCMSHYCKNNGPALDDEMRLAKMMNKIKNPEASRAIQGKPYKERLTTLHGFFKGKIDTYIARSKLYREKLLAGGNLDQALQNRVNNIDRDIAALGDIMDSWPVAEWSCLFPQEAPKQ